MTRIFFLNFLIIKKIIFKFLNFGSASLKFLIFYNFNKRDMILIFGRKIFKLIQKLILNKKKLMIIYYFLYKFFY